mmetsp:Transcript_112612/g.290861  ORF Transcript_112612/g.290861 Transcript_112612/m.290861 type:complete len:443 (-) Transcript_112612:592-1920(-)
MGGLDVIALRGLCAAYAEKHVLPLLRDLQEVQGQLTEQIRCLESSISSKANANDVPTMTQFEKIARDMNGTGQLIERAAFNAISKDLFEKLEFKADMDKVPSLLQFEEVLTKLQQQKQNDSVASIEAKLHPVIDRLDSLAAALEHKADANDAITNDQFDELLVLVEQKANSRDVVPFTQFQKLSATVERKAFANKVPSLAQMQELQTAVANKVDAHLVPTIAQVEELAADVKKKKVSTIVTEQLQKISLELQQKTNSSDALTLQQVELLLQSKLEGLTARKADAVDVPTLAQHKELAATTERKLAFLAAKLQQKNDAMRDWCQQQPAIWCVQPVVDVAWDDSTQGWPEWNPSRAMPGTCEGLSQNGKSATDGFGTGQNGQSGGQNHQHTHNLFIPKVVTGPGGGGMQQLGGGQNGNDAAINGGHKPVKSHEGGARRQTPTGA